MSRALQSARYSGVLIPVTLASANTVAIGAAIANAINITGTATISAFDVAQSGTRRTVVFQGAMTLVHNSVTLSLPGTRNISTTPGDTAEFLSIGGGNWICTRYTLVNGTALLGTAQDHIKGLQCVWNSASSVSFTPGEAYIPGTGKVLKSSVGLTLTGLTGSANTWYHAYLFENNGIATVEIVATAPDATYFNGARGKTGDASRRYLISLLCGTGGAVLQFRHIDDIVEWQCPNTLASHTLAVGAPVVSTAVVCSSCCPVTAVSVFALFYNNSNTSNARLCSHEMGSVSVANHSHTIVLSTSYNGEMPIGYALQFNAIFDTAPTGGQGLTCRANGYRFRR